MEADRKPVLLSGRASKALGLISRVHNIDKYPELKTTTGLLPGTYSLITDPTVKPVVHGPRKLPHALAQRVKDKDWKGDSYLLTVDYYSKFIKVDKLTDQSSNTTIEVLKSQISRHGIPVVLRSENGPQFSSSEFDNFCRDYQIQHKTSSPHFPQSNDEAERAVQTVKKMWKKCSDKQLALLDYRTTPLPSCDLSPAQLLMGRRPRNKLPASKKLLQPKPFNPEEVKKRATQKPKQTSNTITIRKLEIIFHQVRICKNVTLHQIW